MAEEIKKEGGAAHPYVVDCSKREEVYRMAGRVKEEVGNVAVLVNNAGIAPEKAFVNGDLKDEEIEKTYAVNALALYWVSVTVMFHIFGTFTATRSVAKGSPATNVYPDTN